MNQVPQTQFAPLPEALCKVVYDLTTEGCIATMTLIEKRLKTTFPELLVPKEQVLYKALGNLIRERKLYHTGAGYSVVTPNTFRLLAVSPPIERQMLLTNEEAIVRLHGASYVLEDGRAACTQTKDGLTAWSSAERILEPRKQVASLGKLKRCHSLKLLRGRDKEKLSRSNSFKSSGTSPDLIRGFRTDTENIDPIKKEKSSVFSKWFRKGRSDKNRASKGEKASSTQFPPRDWSDPDYVHFNSRATQTLQQEELEDYKAKSRSSSLNRMISAKDRHSQHMSSTPATPRFARRNLQPTDVYRYRSSSLPRKCSPPSRRAETNTLKNSSLPKCNGHRIVPNEAKPRTRYESSFSPVMPKNTLLMAGDKYGDEAERSVPRLARNHLSSYHPNSINYRSPALLHDSDALNNKIESNWRRPVSLGSNVSKPTLISTESVTQPPLVVIPRLSKPPTVSIPLVNRIVAKTKNDNNGKINSSKEICLGTTVDVEISMVTPQTKKTLLNTNLDEATKKDSLKIETTWNHSVKSDLTALKSTENVTRIPKLTTTTNITTSLTQGHLKGVPRTATVNDNSNLTSLPPSDSRLDSLGKSSIDSSLRSTIREDSKSDFFSGSPNTTTEVHLLKEDSGFSSSASTSRPMSVSPC